MLTTHQTPTTDPATNPQPPPVPEAPLRVVVADDHPLYRHGIVRALESSGAFDVIDQASDGTTALALIRRHQPDVAVLDVRMPDMDGIDVIAALARNGPPVPVVLLSAFDDDPLVAAGLEAGAATYLSKPPIATPSASTSPPPPAPAKHAPRAPSTAAPTSNATACPAGRRG